MGGPELKGLFASSQTVLDIGCGSGRDLVSLLQQGIDAVGCDVSDAMLAEAAKTLSDAGYKPEGRLQTASLPDCQRRCESGVKLPG